MIIDIPISPVPNQSFTFSLLGSVYEFTLMTRLDKLYATVKRDGEYVICNRVCRDAVFLCQYFLFLDRRGGTDPTFSELGTRYKLVWIDGF